MFDKIDYYSKYSKKGFKTFTEKDCVICGHTMNLPPSITIVTCCKYCQIVKLTLSKKKGRYTLCRVCDKPVWCQPGKQHSFCSKDCADIGTSIFAHERNIKRGYRKYYGPNWYSQRRVVRARDNYKCQKCGISEKEYNQELSVHHIKPFVLFESYLQANETSNLISLCEGCHRKEHSGDMHHSKYYK